MSALEHERRHREKGKDPCECKATTALERQRKRREKKKSPLLPINISNIHSTFYHNLILSLVISLYYITSYQIHQRTTPHSPTEEVKDC